MGRQERWEGSLPIERPDLSVVVPLHNEEDSVLPLYHAVLAALEPEPIRFELVLVDDGSRDRTYELAADLARQDPRVCVIKFRRNFGQTAAMASGIRHSSGQVVATMDGDLQNDPLDIVAMLALLHQGYDLVVGWRHKRQDATLRVLPSKVANWMIRRLMKTEVKDSGCSLKLYRGELIRNVPLYADMHRFIPALASLAGARLAQMRVRHHPRKFGVSKYGYSRIAKVFLDLISIRFLLGFSRRPYAWVLGTAAPAMLVGIWLMVLSLWTGAFLHSGFVVPLGVGLLMLSLSVFIVTWGLLGLLIAGTGDLNLQDFAKVAARLREASSKPGQAA
jgi:glycosyltransferase involved in cell wall biosynthesis